MDTSLLTYMAAGLRWSEGALNLGHPHMALHLALPASQHDEQHRESVDSQKARWELNGLS